MLTGGGAKLSFMEACNAALTSAMLTSSWTGFSEGAGFTSGPFSYLDEMLKFAVQEGDRSARSAQER
jgi:hypothetical protein